ncbi:hypothetical protein PAXRUDRAFT_833755, partial [Paxillus rubicundulus Ve08.2h10]
PHPLVFGHHPFIFDPAHLSVVSPTRSFGSATFSLLKMDSPPQTWTRRPQNDPATSTADPTCRRWTRRVKNGSVTSTTIPAPVSKTTPSPQMDPSLQGAGVSGRLSPRTRPAASKQILSQPKPPRRLSSRPDRLKMDPSPQTIPPSPMHGPVKGQDALYHWKCYIIVHKSHNAWPKLGTNT